jgi:hypothetical protein
MDQRVFPHNSLDKPIENPDPLNSIKVIPVPQSDKEIVDYVVSDLKNLGLKEFIPKGLRCFVLSI